MSKIIIDARESGTSTGRYVDKLVHYLHGLHTDHQFIILTKKPRLEFMRQVAPDFTVIESTVKEFTFAEQLRLKRQINRLKPDLVHFTMTQQPVLYRRPKVTTVHDLTTLRFDNPDKKKLVFRFKQVVYAGVVKRVARDSTVILTPSQFVKDDLVKFARVDPLKVVVTHEAADHVDEPATVFRQLEGQQFIMYVGRPTPHKNLERLIDAFVSLQAQYPKLRLVLAGKKDANFARIEASVTQRSIKGVDFTGFVDDTQLRWLYEHCSAYVFPSLSEGFGLPALEAMVHGAPVVSSNATCLPEIYGEAAHYFDPLNTQAMADAINEVLTDQNLREMLVKRGAEQVKQYSWQKMAEQTLAVYDRALSS